jgi:hypothetical protein
VRQTHPAEICSDAEDSDLWEAPEKDGPTMEASPKANGFEAMIVDIANLIYLGLTLELPRDSFSTFDL